MNFVLDNWGVIATAMLALSEVLALVPSIKANSIFQLVVSWLSKSK